MKSVFVTTALGRGCQKLGQPVPLSYFAVVVVAGVPWGRALTALVVPEIEWSAAYATAVVAILGTTISPYLFFWQAAQEIEEQHRHHAKPLCITPREAGPELKRIRLDTLVGMGFPERLSYSNLSNAGLGDCCAFSVEAYVQKAAALAEDRAKRREWRQGLRGMIAARPLGDAQRFVDAFYAKAAEVAAQ